MQNGSQEKVCWLFLKESRNGSAIKALTPPPLELNGSRNFAVENKVIFTLMTRPLPPPSLMALPLTKFLYLRLL